MKNTGGKSIHYLAANDTNFIIAYFLLSLLQSAIVIPVREIKFNFLNYPYVMYVALGNSWN